MIKCLGYGQHRSELTVRMATKPLKTGRTPTDLPVDMQWSLFWPIQAAYAITWGMQFCSWTPCSRWARGPLANTATSSPPWVSMLRGTAAWAWQLFSSERNRCRDITVFNSQITQKNISIDLKIPSQTQMIYGGRTY